MMRASCIDPTISAYEILHGPCAWNRYPLAPLGCKAVVYEDRYTRGLWASRDVDSWYLGLSMDHYRCDIYYIPETRAYWISGSTELFPQHCQLPDMTPHQHLRALTNELTNGATEATHTPKGKWFFWLLRDRLTTMLAPPLTIEEQRVVNHNIILQQEAEQRVINDSPILTIEHITNAPGIMELRNPTAKQVLKITPHTHRCLTRNNRPGIMPAVVAPATYTPIPTHARQRLGDTAHSKCTHVLRTESHKPCVHTDSPLAIHCQKCTITHRTLRFTYGTPSDWRDNIKLQKIDAWPSYSWDMANNIWQGLWQHGPRRLKKRAKGHKCNVRYDAWWDQTRLTARGKNHLRESCGQL